MFTGLSQTVGRLDRITLKGRAGTLALTAAFDGPALEIGESIAVNGICLTLTQQNGGHLSFDILEETVRRTALSEKQPGAKLNLERALRMGSPLGGHLVSGHVDGTGQISDIRSAGRDKILCITAPPECMADIIPKGSIAIDGISLTVVDVSPEAKQFTVHIIPHTWSTTALADLSNGAKVNLETDLIGKYVRHQLQTQTAAVPVADITLKRLRQAGFLS